MKVPIVGFTILVLLFQFGMLPDIVGFFLQLLVVFGAVVWGGRTYFVARAEIKNGITPACSVTGIPAAATRSRRGRVERGESWSSS